MTELLAVSKQASLAEQLIASAPPALSTKRLLVEKRAIISTEPVVAEAQPSVMSKKPTRQQQISTQDEETIRRDQGEEDEVIAILVASNGRRQRIEPGWHQHLGICHPKVLRAPELGSSHFF